MKHTIFFLIALILCNTLNTALAQSPGDYRSKQTGLWSTAATWQTYNGSSWIDAAAAPSATSKSIRIQRGHTVTSNSTVTADQLVIDSSGMLAVSGGTFTVADTAGTDMDCNGTVTFSGGTLNGAGSISFNAYSTFNWTGGTNGGSGAITIKVKASLNMPSNYYNAYYTLANTKTLNNYGTWTWSGNGDLYYGELNSPGAAPVINNYGILNISTDADVKPPFVGTTTGAINNMAGGTINKTGASDNETSFKGFSRFTNKGTVNVNSGRLRFYVRVIDSAAMISAAGAAINFTADTAFFNTGTVLGGAGNIAFDGAIATLNAGSVSVSTINVSAGTFGVMTSISRDSATVLNLQGGTLNGTGMITFNKKSTFNWTGGTNGGTGAIDIRPGAILNMPSNYYNAYYTLANTKTINNHGTWNWSGNGDLYYGDFVSSTSAPVINNYGILNMYTDADVLPSIFGPSSGTFNNRAGGTINKMGSPDNETSFKGISQFTNKGTININSSRLRFYVRVLDSATANIAVGADMSFATDTAVFSTGTVLKGGGSISFDGATALLDAGSVSVSTINVSAGVLSVTPSITMNTDGVFNFSGGGTLNGAGTITFNAGSTFNWGNGTLAGSGILTTKAGVSLNMNGSYSAIAGTRTVNNYGTWTWTGGMLYYHSGAPVINNYGTLRIYTDADVTPLISEPGPGAFNNKPGGTIDKIGSPGNGTAFNRFGTFTNEGSININSSSIELNVNGAHTGSYTIAEGAQLNGSIAMLFTGSSFTNDGIVALYDLSFGGTAMQTLKGSGSVYALTVNNAKGVSLGGTQTINRALAFTKGNIIAGNYDLITDAPATIAGAGVAGYVLTNGTGGLQRRVVNNSTDVSFPVGDSTGYKPVAIQLTPASISDDFKVRVLPKIYGAYASNNSPSGEAIRTNSVNGTWIVNELMAGGSVATLSLQWNATDETPGFNRAAARFGQYKPSAWNLDTAKAASGSNPYTLSRSGITSFSAFGITNQFVTCTRSYAAVCAGSGLSVPYTVTGSFNTGNIFTAQLSDSTGSFAAAVNIGSVTATASGNINATIPATTPSGTRYRIRIAASAPAFTSNNNGSNISITSCSLKGGITRSSATKALTVDTNAASITLVTGKLSVYPNPTSGRFTAQLNFKEPKTGYANVKLMNAAGQIVYAEKVPVAGYELKKTVSFYPSGQSSGLYILSITVGSDVYLSKINYQKE